MFAYTVAFLVTRIMAVPVVRSLYPALVAALKPGRRVVFNTDAYGTASGAALLADHPRRTGPAPVVVEPARDVGLAGLAAYRDTWRLRAESHHPNEREQTP